MAMAFVMGWGEARAESEVEAREGGGRGAAGRRVYFAACAAACARAASLDRSPTRRDPRPRPAWAVFGDL